MSKTLASLIIKVGADVSGAVSGMTTVEKASRSLKKEFTGLSQSTLRYRTAMVSLAAGTVLGLVTKNSMEAQRATAQLGAVLKSTGGASGKTVEGLTATASSLERLTALGDEAVESVQGLLLTFTKIKGGTFDQATRAVLDMATAMAGGGVASEGNLKAAAIQVGKALQDPILGITALRRAGVNFSAAQKNVIKNLVETGRSAEAQALILKELQVEFGGSAEAARNTLGGAIAFLKNQMGNFFEVSQEGSQGFIDAINSMGEAVIWARENAMIPFFLGIQEWGADAAVVVGELELAFAKLNRFTGGVSGALFKKGPVTEGSSRMGRPTGAALGEALGNTPASRDAAVASAMTNLGRLRTAAEEVKLAIHSTNWAPYVSGLASVGDVAENAAKKLGDMLRPGAGLSAPKLAIDFAIDPEVIARWKAAQEAISSGKITLFDLKPSVEAFKSSTDEMVDRWADAKKKILDAAYQFRDGFADAVADAVMRGKLDFRSFADFVIAELLRIQTRKIFASILGSVGGSSAASTSGIGTYTGGNRISSPSFNLAPVGAGNVIHQTINFSVSAIDSRDAARFVHEQKGAIAGVVAEAARSSGGYRRALAGA